jgi:MFS family permease
MTSRLSKDELASRIAQKRAEIDRFLAAARPRKRRLLNTTIIGGTLSAALTAGPAVGGPTFTAWLTQTMGWTSPSWRLLCAAASVSSMMAAVATQLLKSQNIEEHVSRAQACRAKLEVLEIGLAVGHLDPQQATAEYLKCVEDAALLEGS